MSFGCELVIVDTKASTRRRVRVTGEEDDPVADLTDRLRRLVPSGGPLFVDGKPFPDAGTLASSELLHGATVAVGRPVASPRQVRPPGLEARIVGGLGAGRSFPLAPGSSVIGRQEGVELCLADREVSRPHAELTVADNGSVSVTDLASTNGTFVEGVKISGPTPVAVGDHIQVGSTLLAVVQSDVEALGVVPSPPHIGVHRRFRGAPPAWTTEVTFPRRPEPGERPSLNLALTLAPAGVMVLVGLLAGRPEMLFFGAVSPLFGVGRAVTQRRSWVRRTTQNAARYEADTIAAAVRLDLARREERVGRRATTPDLAELALHARSPGRRLWERQPEDDDFLHLRLGMSSQRSTVVATGAGDDTSSTAWRIPVSVGLREARNVSVVGPVERTRQVAAAAVLHLGVREAPGNLKLVVLAGPDAEEAWQWVTWLPHCRWAADEPFNLVGSDTVSTKARLAELHELVKQRMARRADRADKTAFLPAVVVVLDDTTRSLREGYADILRDGPDVGIHAVCLDHAHVPEPCLASLTLGDGPFDEARLEQRNAQPMTGVLPDAPDTEFCDVVARAVAPLTALGDDEHHDLPVGLRLLDLLGIPRLTPEAVLAGWEATSPSPSAVIGLAADGPHSVNLTHHGPHGLLIEEVLAAAAERGVRVRVLQRADEDKACGLPGVECTSDNAHVVARLAAGEVDVVAGTAWLFARDDLEGSLDVLVVDEAGQMSLANVVAVSGVARSLVMLGDPSQLAQPLKGSHPPGAEVSGLEHLLGADVTFPPDRGLFLSTSRRLHPDVCAFVSEVFYEGRLQSHESCARQGVADGPWAGGTGVRWIPVTHTGNRSTAAEEVEEVVRGVDALVGRRWTDAEGNERLLTVDDVLVVAPYNAHVARLGAALPAGARVGTVDRFQGQEAPVVVFSMATSSAEDLPRAMEFLYSLNRLNVAVSRARALAVLVCSPELLAAPCRTPHQLQLVNALCRLVEHAGTGSP